MSMSSVQWLNLNRVKLHEIPEEIGKLGKLVCINYINIYLFYVACVQGWAVLQIQLYLVS